MLVRDLNDKKFSRQILLFYILSTLISFIFPVCLGYYNGDFLFYPVSVSFYVLIINLFLSLIPYWFVWNVYNYYLQKERSRSVTLPIKFIQVLSVIIIVAHLVFAVFFDVGKAGKGTYQAPSFITPIIQVLLRFPYELWGGMAVLVSYKKRTVLFYLLLMILVGISKGYLSIMITSLLLFYLRYSSYCIHLLKRYMLFFLFLSLFIPTAFGVIYNMRNQLRGNMNTEKYGPIDIIGGKFFGRLSSFSDSAFLIENAPEFIFSAKNFDDYFFQRNMLKVFGGGLGTEYSPEEILYKRGDISSSDDGKRVSFMLGTQGILIYSLYKSIYALVINAFSIMLVIACVFKIFSMLRLNAALNIALLLILWPVTSGVAFEYASLLVSSFILFSVILFYNTTKKYINHEKNTICSNC